MSQRKLDFGGLSVSRLAVTTLTHISPMRARITVGMVAIAVAGGPFPISFVRNKLGWVLEHWTDIATSILMLAALLLAMIPATVAALEKHPRWGRLWKIAIPIFVLAIGITGFIQGTRNSDRLKEQVRTAYNVLQISATKGDIETLTEHIDRGFSSLITSIDALRSGKRPPLPPTVAQKPKLPPPVVRHIRYVASRIASSNPSSPYGLQVVIQTDVAIQPVGLKITCDGEITSGDFFVAGQPVMMSVGMGTSQDKKSFLLSFGYPSFTPESSIVVRLQSPKDISVVNIEQIPPLF